MLRYVIKITSGVGLDNFLFLETEVDKSDVNSSCVVKFIHGKAVSFSIFLLTIRPVNLASSLYLNG